MASLWHEYPSSANESGRHPNQKHFLESILEGLNKQRKENRFHDVIIIVDGQKFPAHRGILSLVSEYFKTMFNSGFKEASAAEVTVDGNSEAFRRILDFAYSGELYVTAELIFEITQMACYLQFHDALKTCVIALQRLIKWHKGDMDVEIIYQTCLAAQRYGAELRPMVPLCVDYLASRFEKFSQTEIFLTDVTVEFLEQFLDRNDLTALSQHMSEEKVSFLCVVCTISRSLIVNAISRLLCVCVCVVLPALPDSSCTSLFL